VIIGGCSPWQSELLQQTGSGSSMFQIAAAQSLS
jgi:hypothetical protein